MPRPRLKLNPPADPEAVLESFMTVQEVIDYARDVLGVPLTASILLTWRARDKGPRFFRPNPRCVLYFKEDVLNFMPHYAQVKMFRRKVA